MTISKETIKVKITSIEIDSDLNNHGSDWIASKTGIMNWSCENDVYDLVTQQVIAKMEEEIWEVEASMMGHIFEINGDFDEESMDGEIDDLPIRDFLSDLTGLNVTEIQYEVIEPNG